MNRSSESGREETKRINTRVPVYSYDDYNDTQSCSSGYYHSDTTSDSDYTLYVISHNMIFISSFYLYFIYILVYVQKRIFL